MWCATFEGLYHVPPAEMPTPSTVLDLGANIGLTAAHYQTLWPNADIVSVEMDEQCCELIKVNAPECDAWCYAVSGSRGEGFYDPFRWPSNFSLGQDHATRRVVCKTLDDIIEIAFGDHVDFVKMDVEGAEWDIFAKGDWADKVGNLIVELHGDFDPKMMVVCAIAALERLGFIASPHSVHPQAVWATR